MQSPKITNNITRTVEQNREKLLAISLAVIALLTVPAYIYARSKMTMIIAYLYIMQSNITFNFVLFLFLYGVVATKFTKGMSRRKQWLVWAIGMVLLVLFFRYVGGFPTIIG